MRTKVTLVLILLNVALFFFIFYVRGQWGVASADKDRVLGPETANIQSLEISTNDPAATVRLERRGETWSLTQPLDWPANEFAVKRIVNELQFLKHETSFAVRDLAQNGQTLADYGLDHPPLTLTFTPVAAPGASEPQPIVLRIGDTTTVGNRLYVLSPDGERVHVVNRSLAESLTLRLADLRSDTLFTIPVFEVRSFNLQTGAPAGLRIRLRNENNRWFFETPIVARANKAATVLAINSLNALRVKSFLEARNAEPGRTGLNAPLLHVTLEGNNRRETLVIGAPVESTEPPATTATTDAAAATRPETAEHYAKMEDKTPVFIVALPTALLDTLRNAQESLRDTRVLDVEPSSVTAITLTAPGQPEVTLQRLDPSTTNPATSAWQVVRRSAERGPVTMPADREQVERLLQKLNQLKAERFVSDAPSAAEIEDYGFNRPVREITLSLASNQPSAGATSQLPSITLQIGSGGGANPATYARLLNQPFVYQVSEEILHDAPVAPLAYRERLVRELPAGAQITGFKIVDLSNDTTLLETALPVPTEGDTALPLERRAAVEGLAAQLRVLRARSFVRDEFSDTISVGGEERRWRYRVDLTLTLTGGEGAQTTTSSLFFSDRAGGTTQYVGSPEFNLVFEAEQPLLDSLFAVVYGPRDPGPAEPPPTETAPDAPAPAQPQPDAARPDAAQPVSEPKPASENAPAPSPAP